MMLALILSLKRAFRARAGPGASWLPVDSVFASAGQT